MSQPKTYHASQGTPEKTVSGNDIQVITQTDVTGLEGYHTGSTTIDLISQLILDTIKSNGGLGITPFDRLTGLRGAGTSQDPIRANSDYLKNRWVAAGYGHISQVGDLSLSTLPITAGTGFQLQITNTIPVLLGGVGVNVPVQTINLATYYSQSLANKTLRLVFNKSSGSDNITFTVIDGHQTESYTQTFVATIITNATGISSITATPFMRVNNYRLSENPLGGAIPVSSGLPINTTFTSWGGQGSIAPVKAGIDTTQMLGTVTFDRNNQTVTITNSGQFYIKNLNIASAQLGQYYQISVNGNATNSQGTLNGATIWRGKGSSNTIIARTAQLVEGWNSVTISSGSLIIQSPFLN